MNSMHVADARLGHVREDEYSRHRRKDRRLGQCSGMTPERCGRLACVRVPQPFGPTCDGHAGTGVSRCEGRGGLAGECVGLRRAGADRLFPPLSVACLAPMAPWWLRTSGRIAPLRTVAVM